MESPLPNFQSMFCHHTVFLLVEEATPVKIRFSILRMCVPKSSKVTRPKTSTLRLSLSFTARPSCTLFAHFGYCECYVSVNQPTVSGYVCSYNWYEATLSYLLQRKHASCDVVRWPCLFCLFEYQATQVSYLKQGNKTLQRELTFAFSDTYSFECLRARMPPHYFSSHSHNPVFYPITVVNAHLGYANKKSQQSPAVNINSISLREVD